MLFTFTDMTELLSFIPGLFKIEAPSGDAQYLILSYLPLLIAGLIASTPLIRKVWSKVYVKKCGIVVEAAMVVLLLVLCTAALVKSTYNPFLYFRF